MTSGSPVQFRGAGLAGSLVGLLALIAVVIPQWVLPPPPIPAAIEVHQNSEERVAAKFKTLGHKKPKTLEPAGWRRGLPFVAAGLALLALFLGVLSVLRGEMLLDAAVAVILGIGAIAFQMTFFFAIAASGILILYAALERPGGAASLAFIGVCAILVLSVLAVFGMGLASALLLMGTAIAIVALQELSLGATGEAKTTSNRNLLAQGRPIPWPRKRHLLQRGINYALFAFSIIWSRSRREFPMASGFLVALGLVIYILALLELNDMRISDLRGLSPNDERVQTAYLRGGKELLTIRDSGRVIVRRTTAFGQLFSFDAPRFAGNLREQIWLPFGKPIARRVLSLTIQVLPLSIPEEARGKRARSFRDSPAYPEMIEVSGGTVLAGSPITDVFQCKSSGTRRIMTIAYPFAVSRFAVTFDEWDACVADGGCNGYTPSDNGWGRGKHPVVNVSWKDAQAYVSWLSSKSNQPYRLVSEVEREFIARTGSTSPFWWGSSISSGQANFDDTNSSVSETSQMHQRQTQQVDAYEANPWGFYQVHGNVNEWTEDCWNENIWGNAGDGSAQISGDCGRRAVRGGSWASHPDQLCASSRAGNPIDARDTTTGFRVAQSLKP